ASTVQLKNKNVRWIICMACSVPRLALPKYRRADAYHRRSFCNCNFKVVSHTHRELTFAISKCAASAEFISQFAQPAKERSIIFRVLEKWRQGHQSPELEPAQWAKTLHQLRQRRFVDA